MADSPHSIFRISLAALLSLLLVFALSLAFDGVGPLFYVGVELLVYYAVSLLVVFPFFLYGVVKSKTSLWFYVLVGFFVVSLLVFAQYIVLYAASAGAYVNGYLLVENGQITQEGYSVFLRLAAVAGAKAAFGGLVFWYIVFASNRVK